ncbi:MAG: EamA family transporter [Deltaproteobacteria bacterium]|nr:EamA family transporter [Deltaproteobacteria bacterium]MBW2571496.1 EamA family transporter [Deltaproteobacteria bacterium]MBW2711928.1 EamA family transporter [Deltaproteobacteria bacterium]
MKRHGLLEIHIAVILFGLSGLFGKLLTLPPLVIVFGRTFFAFLTLSIILAGFKIPFRVNSRRDFFVLILLGIILAVHWITFFHSIQISTVAVGLLTFSTFPIFVTFMEPVFFKEKIRPFDILTAGSVAFGLLLVIPSFDFQNNITLGAFWGTLSGFTFAVLSILNRKYVSTYPPILMVCCQNGIATLILLPFMFFENWVLQPADYVLLPVLGIFCTALAHVLFIKSLVHIKTQLASITACLEPVYGIIFALFLLGEIPDARTILGGGIMLGTIALATMKRRSS